MKPFEGEFIPCLCFDWSQKKVVMASCGTSKVMLCAWLSLAMVLLSQRYANKLHPPPTSDEQNSASSSHLDL